MSSHDIARAQEEDLFGLCTDFFVLGLQISSGHVELPSCEALMRRVLLMFESMKTKAQQVNVLPTDLEDARFALAAFLDEMIQYSSWPGRSEWAASKLQAVLFHESRAGTRFFERLTDARRRSSAALRVYYACLTLGFMGEYRMTGEDQLAQLIDDVKRELFRGTPKQLSLHGRRPDDRGLGGKSLPLLPIAGIFVVLSVVVIAVLFLLGSSSGSSATELLLRIARGGG